MAKHRFGEPERPDLAPHWHLDKGLLCSHCGHTLMIHRTHGEGACLAIRCGCTAFTLWNDRMRR